jgi:3-polyprenyl-4-hydroxybenzoate decarboxylase
MSYSPSDPRNARVVIDACKPWNRRDTFPIEVRPSKDLEDRVRAKWKPFLPRGA